MAPFKYRVKNRAGQTSKGIIDAESQREAVTKLQQMGHFVLDVKKMSGAADSPRLSLNPFKMIARHIVNPIFGGATVYELAVFYRQFATMVKSGMTLSHAMKSLHTQGGNRRLRKIASETAPFIQSGGQLSEAFARYPWMFPQLHIDLIKAGETGGSLDLMLGRIAEYLEREQGIRQKLRIATFYPKLLVLAVVFIPTLPKLILEGFHSYMQATVYRMIPIVIALIILWGLYRVLYQIPAFRYGVDSVKLAIPKIGNAVKMLALSRFYRVLAAMYSAGTPLSQSIMRASDAAGNGYLTSRLKKAAPVVERGAPLTESMRYTGVLPPMALDMLATGEQTGNVDTMLDKAAEYTENEAEVSVMQITVVVGVLLLLGMAIYIGLIVIGFYAGYFGGMTGM